MPKRRHSDKIEHYHRKIRRLEEKQQRRRQRIVESDTADSDRDSDNEPVLQIEETNSQTACEEIPANHVETDPQLVATPELNPDILAALGDTIEEAPKFGPKIHDNLSFLWLPILRKGLSKDIKDKLLKQNPIPENCPLLQAPKLNPEILAAASDTARLRDKRVESVQQQLGAGITALNKGLQMLLESDTDKLLAVKHLSDSCRLLGDLYFIETEARKKFVTPGLDKAFMHIIQDVERDDMLFGNKLSEKIKASRAIEKQSLQIKKTILNVKSTTTSAPQPSTSYSRPQGNWKGSPRYPPSNRRGRGGPRKTAPLNRRTAPAPQSKTSSSSYHKQRAANQQT